MDEASALAELAKLLAQGKFKETINLCTQIIKANPKFSRAYGFRALSNFELVLSKLSKSLSELTVKALSLKAIQQERERNQIIRDIIKNWVTIFDYTKNFSQDLKRALELDVSIHLDFDIQSTEQLKKHWNEGVCEYLLGAIDIIEPYNEKIIGQYQKGFKTLETKMKILFDKLEHPPENLKMSGASQISPMKISDADDDEELKVMDFGDSLINMDIDPAISNSGILAKSQHIVAYTLNSALAAQGKKVFDKQSDSLPKFSTKDAAGLSLKNAETLKKKEPRKKADKPKKVLVEDKSSAKKPINEKKSDSKTKTPAVKEKASVSKPKTPAAKQKRPAKPKAAKKSGKIVDPVLRNRGKGANSDSENVIEPRVLSSLDSSKLDITLTNLPPEKPKKKVKAPVNSKLQSGFNVKQKKLGDSEILAELPGSLVRAGTNRKEKRKVKDLAQDSTIDPVIAAAKAYKASNSDDLSVTKTMQSDSGITDNLRSIRPESEIFGKQAVLEYRDQVEIRNPNLVKEVRQQFDRFCRSVKGYPFPNMNHMLTPKALFKRFVYVAELKFLYQKRQTSWADKPYDGEIIFPKGFNRQAFDPWKYSDNRYNYESGEFGIPVKESYTFINCPDCESTGTHVCKTCGGTARITCPKCEGMGAFPPKADKRKSPCPECAGAGSLHCPVCDDAGVVICKTCMGKKQLVHYLTLQTEQRSENTEIIFPAEYAPLNASSVDLKKCNPKVMFEQEYKNVPKFEEIEKIFPGILRNPMLRMIEQQKASLASGQNERIYATAVRIYEVEVLYFEYMVKLDPEEEFQVFSADFTVPDFRVYPKVDPYVLMIAELRTELSISSSKNKNRRSKTLIKRINSLVDRDEQTKFISHRMKSKSLRDFRISVLPAFILSLIYLIFMPGIFDVPELFGNLPLMAAPVFGTTFILSLILRKFFSIFPGSFIGRMIFLTVISIATLTAAAIFLPIPS